MPRREREIILYLEDGEEVQLPTKWAICRECRGEGAHSHAIDGNGITSSEWDEWHEDEQEAYMNGDYDQPCDDCGGSGKVKVADLSNVNEEYKKLYFAQQCEADLCDRISEMERKMGA